MKLKTALKTALDKLHEFTSELNTLHQRNKAHET